jgi:serine/threonine protein kinase
MPAPTTVPEFFDLCLKSGIVEEAQLSSSSAHSTGNVVDAAKELVRTNVLTKFQASQLVTGKYKGLRFDRLKILDRIGAGGMGTVFLCEHTGLRKQVAVKVLPPEQAGDEGTRERFFREARASAVLNHRNIVRVHDMNSAGGIHYIVMEYVDGADLHTLLNRQGPLPVQRASSYIVQAAMGLHHAFEQGIVHRDIKPANLLVDREGVVKILDMGLARFRNGTESLTDKYDKGAVLGTADYMAPEQIMSSSDVDIRADIYALGITLYALLSGKPPFSGSSSQKFMGHQTQIAPPLSKLRADVPKGLSAIVERMMAKDPAKRYQTPLEVVEALSPWVDETIARNLPAGTQIPFKQKVHTLVRSKTFLLVTTLTASTLLFGGLGIWVMTAEDKNNRIRADENKRLYGGKAVQNQTAQPKSK